MRLFLLASILLALSACASGELASTAPAAPAASGVQVADDDKVACHRERAIGELVTRTVCEKHKAMSQNDQEDLQHAMGREAANQPHKVTGF